MSEASRTRSASLASQDVYEKLRDQIALGRLAPGTQVTELGLAGEFEVSRTPIREAMSRLMYDGLLERDGRAMRVRVFNEEEVLEIYEVRIALERVAAHAAALRRTEYDLARLKATLQSILQLPVDATGKRSQLAHQFHFALWTAAHNPTLSETLTRLHAKVVGLASTTLTYPGRWEVMQTECSEIVASIAVRDADRAAELNATHMTRSRDVRVEIYGRGLSDPSTEVVSNGRLTSD